MTRAGPGWRFLLLLGSLAVSTGSGSAAFLQPPKGLSRLQRPALSHPATAERFRQVTPPSQALSVRPRGSTALRTASSPAADQLFVQIEELGHPLANRSMRRSLRNFRDRVKDIFFTSAATKAAAKVAAGGPTAAEEAARPSMLRRLVRLARGDAWLTALATVFMLVAAGIEVAVPHFTSQALNAVLLNRGNVEFYRRMRGVLWLGAAAAVTTGLRGFCFGLAGTRMVCRLRHQLLKSLLRQEIAFYDQNQTGELTNRLSADCNKISNLISLNLNILARQTIQLVGGMLYLYKLHRIMALATGLGLMFIFGITGMHGMYNRAMGERTQDVLAKSNAAAGTSLSLIRLVRAHASESTELHRYDKELRQTVDVMEAHDLGYGLYRLVIRMAQTGLLGATLLVGYQLTLQGLMSMEQLTSALFYVGFVSSASYDVGDQFSKIQEALGSASYVFSLLERHPSMSVTSSPPLATLSSPLPSTSIRPVQSAFNSTLHLLHPPIVDYDPPLTPQPRTPPHPSPAVAELCVGSEVVFRNVSFAYPLRHSQPVLRHVDLHIKPGQRIAIVGASGGGKSTLLRLLCRFYDADGGNVYVDGQEVSSMSQEELTSKVAMLSQEPPLLPVSIADNIAYGLKPGAYSAADIESAARSANIHDFIMSLPLQYNTMVGEGAVALSGGQKQRVAIARALIRKPKVLLLDEPTSALDVESEKIVQDALDQASLGRTVLIVAHRLSTIKNAEAIVVLKDGRVVEMGTHEELMGQEGLYASLLQKQGLGMAAKHTPTVTPAGAAKEHVSAKGLGSGENNCKEAAEKQTLMEGANASVRKGGDQPSPSRHLEQAVAVVLEAAETPSVITGTGATAAPTPAAMTA